ncbi:Fibronectin-binding A domain protein [Methanosalsum zhilinae DSM 4017]|uniref:Archaeal Rqc2 homolog aRqcH n=1 Tax=Methanosalsum zhilinae (strain DSM 4017 / NBRC 107636 / OCM 62 / WeN5) TaxID=679901 RepID=F7XPG3_METZD|nr:ribosome rescue protein RqcH [Methanosalsum zhilinae]AEH60292.1 Fibronectin-binding A domain protein [Methanosalsum zhilinae DSM 4017]
MKDEMSSADVSALVYELVHGPYNLIDAKIGKIYQPFSDEIRINLFIHGKGRDNLILEAGKRAHISKNLPPNPKLPPSFPMLLRKHLSGGRILDISQYDFDRIIEIRIVRGGVETVLVAELFARGNIVLLDSERKIILPMKPVTFRGRKIRSGETYEYPESKVNPLEITEEKMKDLLYTSTSDLVRTIATKMNLGGNLSEEICLVSGIDKNRSAKEIDDQEISILCESVNDVLSPLVSGDLKPNIVKKKNDDLEPINVNPFDLKIFEKYEKEYYESFNEALDEYFGKASLEKVDEKVETVKKDKAGVFERRLQQQKTAISKFEKQAEKYVQAAEKIYSYYQDIEHITDALNNARSKGYSWSEIKSIIKSSKDSTQAAKSIINIDPGKGIIVLDLDGTNVEININKSIPQNAEMYYEKAKKVTRKRDGALKALEETKASMQKKEKKEPSKRKIIRKPSWYERFRWFISSDGFLVVGGRDADTNEEIVKKYMEKRDLFFHTQAPGAPVTIIKTEGKEVPSTTIEEASRFVVSYSSLWKLGHFAGDCYMVKPEQVSKTPESGEYLKKGSFVIRGERNYFKNVPMRVAVGIEKDTPRVIGGPVSAITKWGEHIIELIPGKFNQNDIAKKIYRILVDSVEDVSLVRQIASPDKIARMLPPGGSDIV